MTSKKQFWMTRRFRNRNGQGRRKIKWSMLVKTEVLPAEIPYHCNRTLVPID